MGRCGGVAAGGTVVGRHGSDVLGTYGAKGMPGKDGATGGERALRVSLIRANARALAQGEGAPPILLLDEATSALDTDTEREIKEALARAGQGRTVITIAHRLSTVAEADQIVVLEQGEIAEAGSHEDLLARGGRYAHLWQRQQADQDVA